MLTALRKCQSGVVMKDITHIDVMIFRKLYDEECDQITKDMAKCVRILTHHFM